MAEIFVELDKIRDTGPFSSRNTSKRALVQEIYDIFKTVSGQIDVSKLRRDILVENVVHKTSYQTRRKIWNAIDHRYLSTAPQWIGQTLGRATRQGVQSAEFLTLAYLYYVCSMLKANKAEQLSRLPTGDFFVV